MTEDTDLYPRQRLLISGHDLATQDRHAPGLNGIRRHFDLDWIIASVKELRACGQIAGHATIHGWSYSDRVGR